MSITSVGTILIVEDSPSELELMSHYLQESGYKVVKANGAKEAIEKIKDTFDRSDEIDVLIHFFEKSDRGIIGVGRK